MALIHTNNGDWGSARWLFGTVAERVVSSPQFDLGSIFSRSLDGGTYFADLSLHSDESIQVLREILSCMSADFEQNESQQYIANDFKVAAVRKLKELQQLLINQ